MNKIPFKKTCTVCWKQFKTLSGKRLKCYECSPIGGNRGVKTKVKIIDAHN